MSREALETLKVLFKDYPETFNVFNLESLEGDYLKQMFNQEAFASLINLYVTGRIGAGKTSLGNSLLNSSVMKSNGFQDCTDFIGFFKLGGNLSFYDTPGVASNYDYENINRVALLLEQKQANKYSKNAGKPLSASDTLLIKDFSKCVNSKIEPEKEQVTVGQWQSQEMQADVAPDIILYVLAPHMQFLDPDREYLGLLLEKWGKIVIPVLNIHRNENGSRKPTEQNMNDAQRGIIEVYQAVFETDKVPPIVEVNCKKGEGIAQITQLICQTLPPEKVGNFGQVLQDDLKKYAEKERQQRYYRTLSLISAVLSRRTVDKKVDGRSLLQTAGSAINIYGIMTFKTAEALSEVNIDISDKVEGIEKEKTKQKVIKEDITQEQEIKEQRAVYGEIKETKDVVVSKMKIEEVTGWFGRKGKKFYQTNEVETLESTTHGIKDYKDVVVGTINKVIGQTEKFVGTEYEKGGYSAIQFLLSLGLGLEIFCNNQNESAQWSACFEQGQILAERKLESVKPQIEQLIESSTGEKELIKILEGILLK
ncbi:GTPase [Planktothrix agardhii]|uniref:GTPase n=1 Tax=Planktothrix agardhii TaxID=1160 RepID=UPI0003FBDAB7|nr:GTPase [Planktothrix agardhii]